MIGDDRCHSRCFKFKKTLTVPCLNLQAFTCNDEVPVSGEFSRRTRTIYNRSSVPISDINLGDASDEIAKIKPCIKAAETG